ncbi:MAG: lipid A deacylase LpxR family protein [Proteobacteria bacterium]|nr:lipid A deacylase LpxR family protein [Desulfobacula sp.]MBU4133407.1 lipid A deacylase LpxR family protein [Pseudomonadota bacterium]
MKSLFMRHSSLCIIIVFFTLFLPAFAWSKAPSELQTIQLFFENDLFGGTDEYYTNAVQITWLSKDLQQYEDDLRLPRFSLPFIKALPLSDNPASVHNVGVLFGQQIYTPSDTQTTTAFENDRPYAGFLYGGLALHSKTHLKLDTLEIVLGVVGSASKAEQAQNTVHDLRDINTAKGWDNQLHNEPAVRFSWQRKWRLDSRDWFDFLSYDFISRAGVTLGNVRTSTSAGGEIRFGYNIPEDFGSDVIRAGAGVSAPVIPGSKPWKTAWGIHMFASSQIEAIAHDIFLDGNTFRDSQSVDKKPLVADLSLGVSYNINMFKLTYRHLFRTEEFENQKQGQTIGSLTLAVSF